MDHKRPVFMRTLLGSLLLLCSLCGNAADKMTMHVDKSSAQFVVRLPANPTTGYQWAVKAYDKTLLNLTDSQYIAPKAKLMGAGGQMVYTFERATGQTYPDSTQILFKYARPWEAKDGMLKQVTINFVSNLKNKN